VDNGAKLHRIRGSRRCEPPLHLLEGVIPNWVRILLRGPVQLGPKSTIWEHFMTKNIGFADKVVRISAAVLIAVGIGLGWVSGTAAWILGGVAVALIGTSMVSFCGLYTIFGLNTCRVARS
jgi:hypothetical protein